MDDKVMCRVCEKWYGVIAEKHLATHGMTSAQYRELYPDASMMTESAKSRLRKQNPTKGKKLPDHHADRMRTMNVGRKRSDKTKKRISESRTGMKLSEEHKAAIGASVKGKLVGELNPMYGKKPAHGKVFLYTCRLGREFTLRSSWELKVAVYMDRLGLDWDYENTRYTLNDGHTYCPDFCICSNGHTKIVEVKGWMNDKSIRVLKAFRETYPDIDLEVWDEKALRERGIL
jgi:hypothetical protein